jgi:uncharacterized protein YeaO (DUF488 family)
MPARTERERAMIEVKHFLDVVEPTDGCRLWVEPIGLTKDLRKWCQVDGVFSHIAPPAPLRRWFEQHPNDYECFRGLYHEYLDQGPYKTRLHRLALATLRGETLTLLHDGDDPEHNSATALAEFLTELAHWPIEET